VTGANSKELSARLGAATRQFKPLKKKRYFFRTHSKTSPVPRHTCATRRWASSPPISRNTAGAFPVAGLWRPHVHPQRLALHLVPPNHLAPSPSTLNDSSVEEFSKPPSCVNSVAALRCDQASPRVSVLATSTVFGWDPATEYWLTVRLTFRRPSMSISQT